MHAALKQIGIQVSPATCGRIMAENRRLYGLGKQPKEKKEPKEHPYKAQYRHHIWSVGATRFPETAGRQGMGSAPQGATTYFPMAGAIPAPLGEGGTASSLR